MNIRSFILYICSMRVRDDIKKERIFDAALDVALTYGFDGLTINKIAQLAGVAPGTVYIYFKHKEDLLTQLFLKLIHESIERVVQKSDATLPFKIGLKTVWINYVMHRVLHYRESNFLILYYRSSFITEEHKKIAEKLKTPVIDILKVGVSEGIVKSHVSPELLFLGIVGFAREIADEYVNKVQLLTKETIEDAFDMTWDMIKT